MPSVAYAALTCRCPRCGEGKAYSGLLVFAEQCAVCGMALRKHEQGDGPAFFVVLIVGALAAIFGSITELLYAPPFWLHAVLWGPFVMGGTVLALRWCKAALLALHYQYKPEDFN